MRNNLRGRGFPFNKEKVFQEAYPFLGEDSISLLSSEDCSRLGLQILLEELKGAIFIEHREGLPYDEDREWLYSFLVSVYDSLFEDDSLFKDEVATGEDRESCSCLVPSLQSLLYLYPLYRKLIGVDSPKNREKLSDYLHAMHSLEFYKSFSGSDFTGELEAKYRALMESTISEVEKIKDSLIYSDSRKREMLLEGVLPELAREFYFPLLEDLLSYCEESSRRVKLLSVGEVSSFFEVSSPVLEPSLMSLFDFARLINETIRDYEEGELEGVAPRFILDVDRVRFETIMSTSLSDFLLNVRSRARV